MGNSSFKLLAASPEVPQDGASKRPKCGKPCCACLETKWARDDCIDEHGEEKCKYLIEAYKTCMKDLGFEVKV